MPAPSKFISRINGALISASYAPSNPTAITAETASLALSLTTSTATGDTHSILLQALNSNTVVKHPSNSQVLTYVDKTLNIQNLNVITGSTSPQVTTNQLSVSGSVIVTGSINLRNPNGVAAIVGSDSSGTSTLTLGKYPILDTSTNGSLTIKGGINLFMSASGNVQIVGRNGLNTIDLLQGGYGFSPLSITAGVIWLSASSGVTSSAHFVPDTNASRDLGSTSVTWNNIYAKNFSAEGSYVVIPTGTSNPGSPKTGSMYYNTSTNRLFIYNGTAWRSASFS